MSFKTDLREILTKLIAYEDHDEYHIDCDGKDEIDQDEAVDSICKLVEGLVGEEETEELNDFDWRKTRNELRRELKEKLK